MKEMSGMAGAKALAMEATATRGLLELFAAEAMRVASGALGLKTPRMAFEANLLATKTPATRRMPGALAMQATATRAL